MADINPAIKKMQKITFEYIKCNKKLYLDRNFELLTLPSIQKEISEGKQLHLPEPYITNNIIKVKKNFMGNNIFQNKSTKIKTRLLYYQSVSEIIKKEFLDKDFKFEENNHPDDEFIDIQLPDYTQQAKQIETSTKLSLLQIFCCSGRGWEKQQKSLIREKNAVLIHIHGGGFVATSSCTHQSYTRRWANELKIPIISIDYRLSPEYQYLLSMIADRFIVGLFLLRITISKIYLIGDSCGATLSINLCFQSLMKQIRLPDGLFMAYPALNLNSRSFTPSYLYSINDQLIPSKLLKTVLQAYIPDKLNHDVNKDFFLTPLNASDQFFEKLPPIHMVVGERDPLSDDSTRLVEKQQKLQKHIKLIIYKYLPHGFLNFNIPLKGFQFSKICISDSIQEILELIALTNEN